MVILLSWIAVGRAATAQEPTFRLGSGPVVLIDEGHNSLLRGERILSPSGRLAEDGYVIRTLTEPITEAALAGVDIVVVVGPLNDRNTLRQAGPRPAACGPPPSSSEACMAAWNARIARFWRRPTPSAFSRQEIDVLEMWVRGGGSLFLVFDIFPFPGAVEALVGRFGVEVSNGFAVDARRLPASPEGIGAAGELIFRRDEGTLVDHPVTNGRSSTERVDAVISIFGSAFRLPPGGEPLLTFGPSSVSLLPEVAWEFSAATPRQPIGGWSQAGLVRVGDGRVAIFAESGILQPHRPEFDERHPGMGNSELVMNAFRWLAGILDERPESRTPPRFAHRARRHQFRPR